MERKGIKKLFSKVYISIDRESDYEKPYMNATQILSYL